MSNALTFIAVLAGLLFSLSCAVLIEEIFVGGFFRLFFAPQPQQNREKSV